MIEVKKDTNGEANVEQSTWTEALAKHPALAESARILDEANARESREWQMLREGRQRELVTKWLAKFVPPGNLAAVTDVVLRHDHYEPAYEACGAMACNPGDPNLDEIERLGWPAEMLERWYLHPVLDCSEPDCGFCKRMDDWRNHGGRP